MPSAKPKDNPPVLILNTTTLDGSTEAADAQVVALGQQTAPGALHSVGRGNGLSIVDETPALTCLLQGAFIVPAGQAVALVPQDGHVMVELAYLDGGGTGRAFVAAGSLLATATHCLTFLSPGEAWQQWTRDPISVFNSGTNDLTIVAASWGAGS